MPGEVNEYTIDLHWSHHCFRKGHKIMVQVQSTWFPLIDRNPQKYVPNIFEAKDSDFQPAEQRVYRSPKFPSYVQVQVVEEKGTQNFEKEKEKQKANVMFEITFPSDIAGQKVTLGPESLKRFRDTINGPLSNFDASFLKKSIPSGRFISGEEHYEFHPRLIVLRTDKGLRIWEGKFPSELTELFIKFDGSWKTMLSK